MTTTNPSTAIEVSKSIVLYNQRRVFESWRSIRIEEYKFPQLSFLLSNSLSLSQHCIDHFYVGHQRHCRSCSCMSSWRWYRSHEHCRQRQRQHCHLVTTYTSYNCLSRRHLGLSRHRCLYSTPRNGCDLQIFCCSHLLHRLYQFQHSQVSHPEREGRKSICRWSGWPLIRIRHQKLNWNRLPFYAILKYIVQASHA